MERRRFLQLGGLALAGSMARSLWLPPVARALSGTPAGREPILVLVVLQGGNDGLNTVIPYRDPAYYALRPRLAVARGTAIPCDEESALHPALAPLAELWDEGHLAVLRGVGYPSMNLSHFRGSDIVFSGSGPDETLSSGWMARWLEGRYPQFPSLPPAEPMAIQQGLAAVLPLQGERGLTGLIVDNPASFQELVGRTFTGEFPDELGHDVGDELLRRVREIDLASHVYAEVLQSAARAGRNRVAHPRGAFSDQLATVARLIDGNLGTPIYVVSLGGFDTHANQLQAHANLLRVLAEGLNAFFRDLEAMERAGDVVVLTVSEFGRRVRENASAGTDHGTAAPWLLLGQRVLGGVHGPGPDLESLDPAGNLGVALDYRSVYASLLGTWFGTPRAEVERVLAGSHEILPIVAAHPGGPADPDDPDDDPDDDPNDDPNGPGDPGAPPVIAGTTIRAVSPNPGDRHRRIVFDLARDGRVVVRLHDTQGRVLTVLADESLPRGRYEREWLLPRLASGLYFLRLESSGETRTRKIIVQ